MSRRLAGGLLAVAVLVLGFAYWSLRGPGGDVEPVGPMIAEVAEDLPTFRARLFFPVEGGMLEEMPADLNEPVAVADRSAEGGLWRARIEVLVRRLLEGPPPEGGTLPFPEGTELQSIDRMDDGVLFVSLSLPPDTELHLGSRSELLMAYSLVNSLAFSFDEVQRVALLWSGVQPETLAGHVDTTRPLPPSRDWVRATPSEAPPATESPKS